MLLRRRKIMLTEVTQHIHPIIVHFPIAIITIAFLYDVFNAFREGSFLPERGLALWMIAVIGAWISVGTGPEEHAHGNTTYLGIHSTLADITAIIVSVIAAYRLWLTITNRKVLFQKLKYLYLIISVVAVVFIFSVGYYGGKMVYDDGIGVKVNNTYVNPPRK
jgi:uncharacterized membrane protein